MLNTEIGWKDYICSQITLARHMVAHWPNVSLPTLAQRNSAHWPNDGPTVGYWLGQPSAQRWANRWLLVGPTIGPPLGQQNTIPFSMVQV